jgi:hypothetical protein
LGRLFLLGHLIYGVMHTSPNSYGELQPAGSRNLIQSIL